MLFSEVASVPCVSLVVWAWLPLMADKAVGKGGEATWAEASGLIICLQCGVGLGFPGLLGHVGVSRASEWLVVLVGGSDGSLVPLPRVTQARFTQI